MTQINGFITPRLSWPRPATPTDLRPAWAGEFISFNDWVNFATTRLTGTRDPLMGGEVKSVCIDSFGRRCTMGGHFMRARDEGAFPVRFFWDCAPDPDAPTVQPERRSPWRPIADLPAAGPGVDERRIVIGFLPEDNYLSLELGVLRHLILKGFPATHFMWLDDLPGPERAMPERADA